MMNRSIAIVAAVLIFASVVNAHSWLGCADYRGSVDYYDDTKCYAYPRNWETARAGALTADAKGYQLGADTGYNYQATETAACQLPMASPVSGAYSTNYPMAIYEQGQTYCLAWPMKNHGAGTCTNQYIPDTSMKLFRSGVNPTTNPTQTEFKLNQVTDNFGTHTNGQIDCLGFQRAPKFCDNTDRAMATGCFTVPSDLAVGTYVYQWYWIFNQGTAPYTTCWDAQVVAAGTGRGGGGVLNAATIADNLGSGGSTCKTNWAANQGTVTQTTPAAATSTGTTSTPTTPTTDVVVPINGDSIRFIRSPATITTSGTFTVTLQYAATGTRVITVDLLGISISGGVTTANWYGKGTATVTTSTGATTDITVTINTAQSYGAPTVGTTYTLRAWLVDKTVFDAYELEIQKPAASQNAQLAQPWTQEMDRADITTVASTSVVYYSSTGTNGGGGGGLSGNAASSRATVSTGALVVGAAVAAILAL